MERMNEQGEGRDSFSPVDLSAEILHFSIGMTLSVNRTFIHLQLYGCPRKGVFLQYSSRKMLQRHVPLLRHKVRPLGHAAARFPTENAGHSKVRPRIRDGDFGRVFVRQMLQVHRPESQILVEEQSISNRKCGGSSFRGQRRSCKRSLSLAGGRLRSSSARRENSHLSCQKLQPRGKIIHSVHNALHNTNSCAHRRLLQR